MRVDGRKFRRARLAVRRRDLQHPSHPAAGKSPADDAALACIDHEIVVRQRRVLVHAQLREQIGRATSELQSLTNLVCRLLLEKKKKKKDVGGLSAITMSLAAAACSTR